jgi:His/Glu/Gln/Arg/opine family amino acid ABC transporter permease subunit
MAYATVFDQWWAAIEPRALEGTMRFWESIYKEIYLNLLSHNRYMDYLRGLGVTLEVSLLAALMGAALGVMLAFMKLSRFSILGFHPLEKIASWYIGLIRGTPLLLQVMLINFAIFQNVRLDKVVIGVIACGLNSAAYVAEIIRGGILSVDHGQTEAGRSLGLPAGKTMRLIVLPQAAKMSLPAMCNEFIVLIKETSVLAYIALTELTKAGDYIRSRTFSAFTPYIITGILYLSVTTVLSRALGKLERRLRQGDNR